MRRGLTALPAIVALFGLTIVVSPTAVAASPLVQSVLIPSAKPQAWPGVTTNNWSGYGGVTSGTNKVTYTSATWKVPSVEKIPSVPSA